MRFRATALVLMLVLGSSLGAKNVQAPLPPKIMQAKSVFIENKTGVARISDTVFQKLTEWGRYSITTDRTTADLVFVITEKTHQAIASDDTMVTNQVGDTKVTNGGGVYSYTAGSVTLTILDAHDDGQLWVNTWGFCRKGATHELMDDFRKRVKSQEKKK